MGISLGVGKGARKARASIGVALVGREEPGAENLSLRYLAAALDRAGHRPAIVPLSGPDSLPRAALRILEAAPSLVGLSMPDSDATIDALAFVRYLRARGYAGHVTCGGPVATLVRHELLDHHPGIDSVIRHDGEVPVTLLASRLAELEPWDDVPGISTRRGDGPPSPVADPTPLQIRPMHASPLPRLLGIPTARLSASRGCPGRCPYCTPAALQQEALREGRAAGLSREALAEAGVGRTRHRHHVDLADEVAELYHDQGARFFQIVDENLLSGEQGRAEGWLVGLIEELRRRGVRDTAWCLQADPETLTPRVIDLLEELGVVRISVGIEGLTTPQLRSLGRGAVTSDNQRLLARLAERGFVTTFNSLIVHSQSTADGIARELDALAAMPPLHFDVLSMAVYPGTQAYKTLLREGRVTGGMLAMRFEPHDVVVNRFRAALIRLRLQALGRYGTNILAHDVAINVALARRLGLPAYAPSLEREVASALESGNAARLRAYRSALALAHAELTDTQRESAMVALVSTLERELWPGRDRLVRVQARLEGSTNGRIASTNLMIASAMAAGFALCLATGCGGKVETHPSTGSGGESGQVQQGGTGGTSAGGVFAGAGGRGVSSGGAGGVIGPGGQPGAGGVIGLGGQPGTGGVAAFGGQSGTGGAPCAAWQVQSAIDQQGCPGCEGNYYQPYGVVIDSTGHVVDVIQSDGGAVPADVRQCYLLALEGQTFPCLNGEQVWYECVTTLL